MLRRKSQASKEKILVVNCMKNLITLIFFSQNVHINKVNQSKTSASFCAINTQFFLGWHCNFQAVHLNFFRLGATDKQLQKTYTNRHCIFASVDEFFP